MEDAGLATVTSKRALLVISHALERVFEDPFLGEHSTSDPAAAGGPEPDEGLVIGFFQRREQFDVEAARYAALAA